MRCLRCRFLRDFWGVGQSIRSAAGCCPPKLGNARCRVPCQLRPIQALRGWRQRVRLRIILGRRSQTSPHSCWHGKESAASTAYRVLGVSQIAGPAPGFKASRNEKGARPHEGYGSGAAKKVPTRDLREPSHLKSASSRAPCQGSGMCQEVTSVKSPDVADPACAAPLDIHQPHRALLAMCPRQAS